MNGLFESTPAPTPAHLLPPRKIIIVLGLTGFGKSVWTRAYVAGIQRLFVFDPVASYNVDWMNQDELIEALDDGRLDKKFRVGSFEPDAPELIGSLAFLQGNCTMVLEEASLVFTKGARIEPWASQVVFLGRHRATSLIVTAQRATSIPIEIRSQAHRVVSFAQTDGDDLKALRSFFGDDYKGLADLQPLECYDAGPGGRDFSHYAITP
jgi:DNA helicase HerA-like ATPase